MLVIPLLANPITTRLISVAFNRFRPIECEFAIFDLKMVKDCYLFYMKL